MKKINKFIALFVAMAVMLSFTVGCDFLTGTFTPGSEEETIYNTTYKVDEMDSFLKDQGLEFYMATMFAEDFEDFYEGAGKDYDNYDYGTLYQFYIDTEESMIAIMLFEDAVKATYFADLFDSVFEEYYGDTVVCETYGNLYVSTYDTDSSTAAEGMEMVEELLTAFIATDNSSNSDSSSSGDLTEEEEFDGTYQYDKFVSYLKSIGCGVAVVTGDDGDVRNMYDFLGVEYDDYDYGDSYIIEVEFDDYYFAIFLLEDEEKATHYYELFDELALAIYSERNEEYCSYLAGNAYTLCETQESYTWFSEMLEGYESYSYTEDSTDASDELTGEVSEEIFDYYYVYSDLMAFFDENCEYTVMATEDVPMDVLYEELGLEADDREYGEVNLFIYQIDTYYIMALVFEKGGDEEYFYEYFAPSFIQEYESMNANPIVNQYNNMLALSTDGFVSSEDSILWFELMLTDFINL